jgi:toxin YoeB
MKIVWARSAWADYQYWSRTDERILNKINALIEDIDRSPFRGIGKPEPLRQKGANCRSCSAAATTDRYRQ